MSEFLLRQKLKSLCACASTLLWLEGSKFERVVSLKLSGKKLVLGLANETARVVSFEKFVFTSVGIQFWSQGRPGVLYKWDQVPKSFHEKSELQMAEDFDGVEHDDGDGPPDLAA